MAPLPPPLAPPVVPVFALALAIRLGMLGVGAWMDRASSSVKYTDIDYLVFGDAAHFLNQGGSPYERDTYRYTPFLAYLLLPNLWVHPAWGKVLFVASDLLVGLLIMRISAWTTKTSPPLAKGRATTKRKKSTLSSSSSSSPLLHASLWLFNPLVINFSTRGSADTLVSALVLATVLFVQQKRPVLAGFFHGAAVHFKLYPIVFSFSYLAALPSALPAEEEEEGEKRKREESRWRRFAALITKDRLILTAISATTFLLLTLLAFLLFGHPFLQHGLLYHLTRTDNRHNFSPWFYAIYLDFQNEARRHYLGLAAFLPQVLLLAFTSFLLGPHDLPFCIAIQTMIFVAFNKVCTAQYFAWYFSVLPAAGPTLASLPPSRSPSLPLLLAGAWLGAVGGWLWCAYQLEFLGRNTFFGTWVMSIVFLGVNMAVLAWLVEAWGRGLRGKEEGEGEEGEGEGGRRRREGVRERKGRAVEVE